MTPILPYMTDLWTYILVLRGRNLLQPFSFATFDFSDHSPKLFSTMTIRRTGVTTLLCGARSKKLRIIPLGSYSECGRCGDAASGSNDENRSRFGP